MTPNRIIAAPQTSRKRYFSIFEGSAVKGKVDSIIEPKVDINEDIMDEYGKFDSRIDSLIESVAYRGTSNKDSTQAENRKVK